MTTSINTRALATRAAIALSAFVVALMLAFAGASSASAKGNTTLQLDPGAGAALTSLGVSVAPVAPATAGPAGVSFPITGYGGSLFPAALTIKHSGGLSLKAGATTVTLTNYTIRIGRTPDLVATVNGGPRVSILRLDLSRARLGLNGGITLGPVRATLTQEAASALNGAFGVTAFTKGLVLGNATVRIL